MDDIGDSRRKQPFKMPVFMTRRDKPAPVCPDCNGPAGQHYGDRCDGCHAAYVEARDRRRSKQLADPRWWIESALRDIDKWPEDSRDSLVEAARILSRRIRREAR